MFGESYIARTLVGPRSGFPRASPREPASLMARAHPLRIGRDKRASLQSRLLGLDFLHPDLHCFFRS